MIFRCAAILVAILCAIGCNDTQTTPASPSPSAETRATVTAPVETSTATSEAAQKWGALTGRFVWDGPLPELKDYPTTKDVDICGESQVNESIKVNADDKGLANVFVWLVSADVPAHPDLADAPKELHVHARGCRFVPHCTTIRVGQSLVITNEDVVPHNPIPMRERPVFGRVISPGSTTVELIDRSERLPFRVVCPIHPWMLGWVLAQDHPYVAVTDEHGHFEIPKLPNGMWDFQTWHETAGVLTDVSVGGKPAEWKRGRFVIDVNGEATELGTVSLAPSLFDRD